MDLAEGPHSGENRSRAQDGHRHEDVAQGQTAVVEEVYKLHAENRSEEGHVGQRSSAYGFRQVVEVGSIVEPLRDNTTLTTIPQTTIMLNQQRGTSYHTHNNRQSSRNDQRDGHRDDLVAVLGGLPKDMMDLRPLAVSEGRRRGGRRGRVCLDFDVEGVGDEALGGAKGSEDDGGMERLGRQEELGGDVFLGLYREEAVSTTHSDRWRDGRVRLYVQFEPCPCRCPSRSKGKAPPNPWPGPSGAGRLGGVALPCHCPWPSG